ncbi:GNAT domain-containing protein [Desarmillaria tabescens]|uniref:GNAT domain-containing protein n=1 Tax=Armillaria tabescens TaxID=1929756 RepID=A0AA39NE91_ARMTA|nr:GNAT domain-containing protein [Desarmillaria tabescens]KAK0464001.1 GNAT domain-containing protein [Desarmillaria tabescens]
MTDPKLPHRNRSSIYLLLPSHFPPLTVHSSFNFITRPPSLPLVLLTPGHGHGQYLVSLKETSKHVGIVSLMKGDSPEQSYPVPDVGFAMLPEVSGQGYATEAARKLLDYASEVLGVKEVFGFTDAKNTASRRVLEKLGLEDRGVHLLRVFNFEASSVSPHRVWWI